MKLFIRVSTGESVGTTSGATGATASAHVAPGVPASAQGTPGARFRAGDPASRIHAGSMEPFHGFPVFLSHGSIDTFTRASSHTVGVTCARTATRKHTRAETGKANGHTIEDEWPNP